VGTVASYSAYLGIELSKDEIAKISRNIELNVQGIASRMDTFTETYGGINIFPANSEGYERIKL